jgi:uncharacterized protein
VTQRNCTAPLRREARVRAVARGQAEVLEYARNNGDSSVRPLSVEKGVSYRGIEVVFTISGQQCIGASAATSASCPGAGWRCGGAGQLETGVSLNLLYRMER